MPKVKLFNVDEMLEKAGDVFSRKGYNGTSVSDLLKATGLSRSSLYDTYKDKKRLYLASLQRYKSQNESLLNEQARKNSSPRGRIESVFKSVVEDILREPFGKGCFVLNSSTELGNQMKDVARETCNEFQALEDFFFTQIKLAQAAGEISRQHKPRALARYLFSSFYGIRVMGQSRPERASLEDVVRVVFASLD